MTDLDDWVGFGSAMWKGLRHWDGLRETLESSESGAIGKDLQKLWEVERDGTLNGLQ